MLGHINNVEYYLYFETTLLTQAGFDWRINSVIPLVVENHCNFRRPLIPTDHVDGGARVDQVGRSSVTYRLALFMPTDETPSAHGCCVHVLVDRKSERPVN